MKSFLFFIMMLCVMTFTGCKDKEVESQIEESPDMVISQNTDTILEKKEENKDVDKNSEDLLPNTEEVIDVKDVGTSSPEPTTNPEVKETGSLKDETSKNVVIPQANDKGITTLKFKNTNSDEYIKTLNGKQVSITGYLSTLSPLNGEFAYLMNMPYQSCPFCVPGTSEITNTLAIFAGNKSKIKFTDQPVTVVGTLEVGDFSDEFGYQYGVRLNNVVVSKADIDKLSDTVRKYNLLAENGVVSDIYNSIMTADMSVFYNYYRMEKPDKIIMDGINATKKTVDTYNSKGEYNVLAGVMNDLISLCESVNKDIDNSDFSKFSQYQTTLQDIYYPFGMWMAEGEL